MLISFMYRALQQLADWWPKSNVTQRHRGRRELRQASVPPLCPLCLCGERRFAHTQLRIALGVIACSFVMSVVAFAQTPSATPPISPAQQDATRPPGTERRQSVPVEARPIPQDPTAPPGAQRPAPQPPPGRDVAPQPVAPPNAQSPALDQTAPAPGANTGNAAADQQSDRFAQGLLPARTLPPLPSLMRLGVNSDQTLPLTMNEAIRRALENNNDIEVARGDVRVAETLLRSLEGFYEPFFNLTPQISNSVTPQASALSGSNQSGTVTQTNIQFDHSAVRFFERGGGRYEAFFNNNRNSTSSTFSQFNPVYSSNLGITFTQPLLRDRAIDNSRRQIRIQRKRIAQTDADFRRLTIAVIAQVQNAYWELVFALRNQQNQITNLNLTRELFRQTEQRIAAGATAPLERAEVQTELASRESEVLVASQLVSRAENALKRLILRDSLAGEWSAQVLPTDQPSFDSTPINLNDALEEARSNRPELSRLRLQRDISDIDIQYFRNQTKPRIDIQSTLATTGLAGSPVVPTGTITGGTSLPVDANGQVPLIAGDPNSSANAFLLAQINQVRAAQGLGPAVVPTITPSTQTQRLPEKLIGGYGQTLRNLLTLDTRNIVVGVAIQIPFRNKTAEANLAGARIQREQLNASVRAQEQLIAVEVRDAAQAVDTARRRVLSARAARDNAELQLAGEQRLYQVGRSTTFLLFQRENQLANARNLELRAETDYNKALAELQRATSTTLRANNVIVQTPTIP